MSALLPLYQLGKKENILRFSPNTDSRPSPHFSRGTNLKVKEDQKQSKERRGHQVQTELMCRHGCYIEAFGWDGTLRFLTVACRNGQ